MSCIQLYMGVSRILWQSTVPRSNSNFHTPSYFVVFGSKLGNVFTQCLGPHVPLLWLNTPCPSDRLFLAHLNFPSLAPSKFLVTWVRHLSSVTFLPWFLDTWGNTVNFSGTGFNKEAMCWQWSLQSDTSVVFNGHLLNEWMNGWGNWIKQ